MPQQKLYCYVDETGQDTASEVFIVVAVLSDRNQENLRDALIEIEELAGVRYGKWHNSKPARRVRYIELALDRRLGQEDVFFGSYPKPLPYLLPMIEVLERAIKAKAAPSYTARVFVDGIDPIDDDHPTAVDRWDHRRSSQPGFDAQRLHPIQL